MVKYSISSIGSKYESVVLSQEDDIFGVDIPKGVWHRFESLEENSVISECKKGPFVPHEEEGLFRIINEMKAQKENVLWNSMMY